MSSPNSPDRVADLEEQNRALRGRIRRLRSERNTLRIDLESLGEILKGEQAKYERCLVNCDRLRRQLADLGFDPCA